MAGPPQVTTHLLLEAFALEAEVALYTAGGLNDREAEGVKQAGECW